MEKIDKNDKVTLFAGDAKLLEMSIKGILGNLQIKASSKEPYTTKIKAKVQAGNNFLKTELYGIMTYEELLKTQSSIDHEKIPTDLTNFDAHVCIGNECANLKGCTKELCNDYQIHSKPTPTPLSTSSDVEIKDSNHDGSSLGGVGIFFLIILVSVLCSIAFYFYRQKRNGPLLNSDNGNRYTVLDNFTVG